MGFLSPWFLGGLLAVGLPIYLHLLKQHKQIPVPFSSLMFFEKRTQSSVKHKRLKHILLFVLRLLLLILLALLFAGPYILQKPSSANSGKRNVVIAVDHSFSMRQGAQLEKAKREAAALAAGIGNGARAEVLSVGMHSRAMSQMISDPGQLRASVDAIAPSDERSDYSELGRAIRGIAEAERVPLEVHFFTDAQQTSMPANFSDLAMPADAKLTVHRTRDSAKPNWTVETVTAPGRIFDTKKARVQATIVGYATPAAKKQVKLIANGKTLDSKSIDLAADGRASVEFVSLDSSYGFNKCEIRIEPPDEFPSDDVFRFAIERADPRRVLFVHSSDDARSPLYYRTALEAAGNGNFVMDVVSAGQALNQSPEKFAFIVLSDPGPLAQSFEDSLKRYVNAGGAVLITLGRSSVGSGKVPITGDALDGTRIASRSAERFYNITWTDTTNPVIAKTAGLDRVKFYQIVNVQGQGWRHMARASNGNWIMAEKQMGEGRIMVLASAFDNVANDLPLHPTFLPLVEQSARWLARETESATSMFVGAPLELRTARERATNIEILDPDGKRVLSLEESLKAQTISLDREGFYEIRRAQGRQSMVAVNAPRLESNLAMVPPETLALWENKGKADAATGAQAAASDFEKPQPVTYWRPLLALLLLAVLAESFIASRHLETGEAVDDEIDDKIHKEAA